MVAILSGVAVAIYLQHATIDEGLHQIGRLRWGWVVAASLAEVVSMVGLALLYRDLLRANRARLTVPWILACCFTSNAVALSVPVIGSGVASRRTFRFFCRGGADATTASFALTVAGVVSTVTMVTVVAVGAILSGDPAAAVGAAAGALVLLGAALLIAVELHTERGRRRLLFGLRHTLQLTKQLVRRPKREAGAVAGEVLSSVEQMRLGAVTTARILTWGLLNWWADVACLAFCLFAVGITHLAAGKIILVWVAGTGAASLSPTPGGIGAVEIAMIAALAAFGTRSSSAVLAVLVYRLITFKIAGSLWGAVYEQMNRAPLAAQ